MEAGKAAHLALMEETAEQRLLVDHCVSQMAEQAAVGTTETVGQVEAAAVEQLATVVRRKAETAETVERTAAAEAAGQEAPGVREGPAETVEHTAAEAAAGTGGLEALEALEGSTVEMEEMDQQPMPHKMERVAIRSKILFRSYFLLC